jgi:FMN reductase
MKIAIVSCSLNPNSRSRMLAREAERLLKEMKAEPDFIDLQGMDLPFAGAAGSWEHPDTAKLTEHLAAAEAILMAVPIYTYDVNAAAKNVAELCGGEFENKVVGFLCSAGGMGSYMSVMAFANSLMFDFRSWVVPRFVYATKEAMDDGKISDPKLAERIKELCSELLHAAKGLKH